MNCHECQSQIGAARDGELDDSSRMQLEAHLAECNECREAAEDLDRLDALLRHAARPLRRRADELAAHVALELSKPTIESGTMPSSLWPKLTAAVAAGFLIACLLFQPWRDRDVPGPTITIQNDSAGGVGVEPDTMDVETVALVTATTGPIDVRFPDVAEWVTVTDMSPFSCPGDTCVKTPSGSLCELATTTGSVVRLRDDTEVKVHTSEELQLNAGQVWVHVPDSGHLRVTAYTADSTSAEDASIHAEAVGPAVMQCVNPNPLTVRSCAGAIDVGCGSELTRLDPGGCVQIVDGALVSLDQEEAPLLADAWMHPLIMRKGHQDPELAARVDALLGRIGNLKVALMYEQQIRGLGEYGALPLLRFIETPPADADGERRATAARILADIAPVWMVPDLIGLLSDEDPRVRYAADRALVRLTGRASGMTADDWRTDQRAKATEEWRMWWSGVEEQYTPAPVNGTGWDMDELLYQKARVTPD